MKLIPLTQGKFAMVDDADYDWLNQWKWCASKSRHTYYATRVDTSSGKRINIKMHRLISEAKDGELTDHENGNGLDNQRHNLRNCSHSENNKNKKAHGKSKYLGVSIHNKDPYIYWRATIKSEGKYLFLGYFNSELEAAIAYNNAAIIHHGKFARLNEIQAEMCN